MALKREDLRDPFMEYLINIVRTEETKVFDNGDKEAAATI